MTTYCHVANGVVDNRAVFDGQIPADWPDHANWVASEDAQIGWTYSGGAFTAPPAPPPPTPPEFPDLQPYQFEAALRYAGLWDQLMTAIGGITDPMQKALMQAMLNRSTYYRRSDPAFDQFGSLIGKTPSDIDALWKTAAAIQWPPTS